tara:strand:- start:1033 stop:1188 length:156 start_codon:yes stop_codon:yes gene_type:complete
MNWDLGGMFAVGYLTSRVVLYARGSATLTELVAAGVTAVIVGIGIAAIFMK